MTDRVSAERAASDRALFSAVSLLFATSMALTLVWCTRMSAMGGMPMPGGWTMSMAWMRMPGQTALGAAGAFLGMWIVMMIPMMLPSLMPMLRHYSEGAAARGSTRRFTAVVGIGYFSFWAGVGAFVFPLGIALADAEMQEPGLSRVAPVLAAVIVLIAGALQLTTWKAHRLACCREEPPRCGDSPPCGRRETLSTRLRVVSAWRHGVRLGVRCGYCCANLMAILLAVGVMDARAMIAVTAAISAERLAPAGDRIARATGAVIAGIGLILIVRSVRLAIDPVLMS